MPLEAFTLGTPMSVKLTSELVEAFAGMFLSTRYDNPRPTPPFHRDAWKLYCSDEIQVAVIAPRDHAKSTGLTFAYILAEVLFKSSDYVILVGSTEEKAAEQLSNISEELHDNDDLRREFAIHTFEVDTRTEVICQLADGHRFRILSRGAEQRIRGSLWKGKRPNLIVCHAKGTIITADGQQMLVEHHPTAKLVSTVGQTVHVHGLPYPETVTDEHKYWVQQVFQRKRSDYVAGKKVRNWTEYFYSAPNWKEAFTLDNKCWIGHPISTVQTPFLGETNLLSDDFWWLVGLWWGDGTLSRQSITWYVADKDVPSIGHRIKQFFSARNYTVTISQRQGCVSMTVTCAAMHSILSSWEHPGNSQKIAPPWVMELPFENQADIIRGYIAADGWIDHKTQQVRLTSVCYQGLIQVRMLLARLGIVATIRHGMAAGTVIIEGRVCEAQKKYDLMFRDGASKLGYNIVDSDRYKLKKNYISSGFIWSQVHTVSSSGLREFIPIQTVSHTYLTDFGLSHNCDDMEDDEQVENKDRRAKFRRWFFRALKQALSKSGKIRVHGTILHEDSLLNRIRGLKTWRHLFYKAHAGFDDFSDILWPERWTEEQLRARRQEFIEDHDAGGYAQEFLNDPEDSSDAFLRRDDFIPMSNDDFGVWKRIACAWDFAISKADLANRTSCTVGGKAINNILHFMDFRVGRWSPTVTPVERRSGEIGWVDLMFEVEERWHPDVHFVEDGAIWQAVKRLVYEEMQLRDRFLVIQEVKSIKDKATRGTSLRRRHRAGATRWNTEAEGYEGAKAEMLRFTGRTAARLDDQFDSAALLSLGFDTLGLQDEGDDTPDEELEMLRQDPRRSLGRNSVTGY